MGFDLMIRVILLSPPSIKKHWPHSNNESTREDKGWEWSRTRSGVSWWKNIKVWRYSQAQRVRKGWKYQTISSVTFTESRSINWLNKLAGWATWDETQVGAKQVVGAAGHKLHFLFQQYRATAKIQWWLKACICLILLLSHYNIHFLDKCPVICSLEKWCALIGRLYLTWLDSTHFNSTWYT